MNSLQVLTDPQVGNRSTIMTTIKKGGKHQSSYVKIFAIVAVLIIGAAGFYSATGDDIVTPSLAQVRSSAADVAAASGGGVPASDEGRLFAFELSTGTIMIQTRPSWAPLGVAQFHELVDSGFFDGCRFFRVLPNFMVQFGISVS